MVTLADIEAARERIRGGIYESPCVESIPLSQLTGAHIYCKLDYLQRTGSFKERGARNALLQLSPEQRTRGVIAASAGNHAQGVAYHGSLLGIPVTVVMPKFASLMKVTNCRQLGATVVLHGADLSEARAEAEAIAAREGLTFIHPFDNAHVIAGQGTIALEILEQTPERRGDRRPRRRRRVARRHRHGGQGAQAGRARGRRRAGACGVPHRGAGRGASGARDAFAHARRWPRRHASGHATVRDIAPRRRSGRDRRRGDDRARRAAPDRAREKRRRRRRRGAARRVPRRQARRARAARRSCWCCAAATST